MSNPQHLNEVPSWMESSEEDDYSHDADGYGDMGRMSTGIEESLHSDEIVRQIEATTTPEKQNFITENGTDVWLTMDTKCSVGGGQSSDENSSGLINWEELTHVGSAAVAEMLRTAMNKSVHTIQKSISQIRNGSRQYSDLGAVGGFSIEFENGLLDEFDIASYINREYIVSGQDKNECSLPKVLRANELPPFSSLPWIERQLVNEWRTLSIRQYRSRNISKSFSNNSISSKDIEIPTHSKEEAPSKENESKSNEIYSREAVAIALDISVENCNEDIRDCNDVIEEFEHTLDLEFELARSRIPKPLPSPQFRNSLRCFTCGVSFLNSSSGMVRRHHCRLCARSFCRKHAQLFHKLPHIGYDPNISERVCESCKDDLDQRDFSERTLWKIARCRDFLQGNLIPYFEPGIDTAEDIAWRITQGAIAAAKRIPLGAQAYVAIETVDNLRKHGLKGIYALVLRKEFMAAADLLRKVTGIEKSFPLSVHDLTAAIFYALAQHKAVRGNDPEREHLIHSLKNEDSGLSLYQNEATNSTTCSYNIKANNHTIMDLSETYSSQLDEDLSKAKFDTVIDENDDFDPLSKSVANLLTLADEAIKSNGMSLLDTDKTIGTKKSYTQQSSRNMRFKAVCDPVDDATISSFLFYAPLALYFVYAENEVDIQLLAGQQNWQLLYANLEKDSVIADRPASALFVHQAQKIACFAIRGTASTNDVVTDIRAIPVPFPEESSSVEHSSSSYEDDWTSIIEGKGLALCGMARAATHLFRENISIFTYLMKNGYRIRITGHSLGGGVASLLGALIRQHFERCAQLKSSSSKLSMDTTLVNSNNCLLNNDLIRVYSFGTPSCVDERLAAHLDSFVTSVILHDDVVPRLTPTSIRRLIKHLLYIKETWVKIHLNDDMNAIADRVSRAWAPRFRGGTELDDENESPKPISITSSEENEESEICDIDGDIFFEAEETLIESDDESDGMSFGYEENIPETNATHKVLKSQSTKQLKVEESAPFDEPPLPLDGPNEETVIVEELPLPRMFVPGRIAHIYTHRGGYKIAYVPRQFKDLRSISMAGNMLKDHMAQSYYEALMEVRSVRRANTSLPRWSGFAEDSFCNCCSSRFTWASTSNSLAQEIRDKHNCRSCGKLVCGPCSGNRASLPDMGLETSQLRVCDKCYYKCMGKKANMDSMTRSFCTEDN